MAYEVDFVGSETAAKDYDAIAFRYTDKTGAWMTCVFDGGTSDAGEDLVKHLKKYYTQQSRTIDVVFCSHPDLDHASGLKRVLEEFTVRYLVMNRPWLYIDELYERVKDGRITKESLERTLREKYKYVNELEEVATSKHCKILNGLSDNVLCDELKVLSPSRDFYIQCLVDSEKTPAMDSAMPNRSAATLAKKIIRAVTEWIKGIWGVDAIREGETTSSENESSIVLRVSPVGDKPFLFVGDAGCKGITAALDLADEEGTSLKECDFVQVPHHGGRHNVSPSVLDRLIGPKVSADVKPIKTAFVSVWKDSDHPRKCVTNAFLNRGCEVYVSREQTLHHHRGQVPDRGWAKACAEPFSEKVESWDV